MNAIFIGGCPRSGTTMLGSMLGAGGNCFVTPESQFKDLLVHDDWSIKQIEEALIKNFRLNLWRLDNISFDGINSKQEVLPYLLNIYRKKQAIPLTRDIWVDHTPDNFEMFDFLMRLFPDAWFIHIIRDSRGVVSSVMPLDWGPNEAAEAADWWLQKVAFGFSAQIVHPQRVFHVRYEDILLNPENTIKSICKKVGIDFNTAMLYGDKSFLPDYTLKQHSLVGKLPRPDQVTNWQLKLSKKELEVIEKKTGPVLINFGYQVTHLGKWRISFSSKIVLSFKRLYNDFTAKLRSKKRRKRAVNGSQQ